VQLQVWLSFALFTLTFSVIPGPSIGFTVAYAIRHGFAPTSRTIAGQLLANVVQIAVVCVGLSRVLESSAELFAALKVVGAAYLVVLGVRHWLARSGGATDATDASTVGRHDLGRWRDVWRGFVVCGMNPKAFLYYGALLPQFISPDAGRLEQLALLGATNLAIGAVVMCVYALVADKVSAMLQSSRSARVRDRVAGSLLIASAAYLALGRRT